MDALQNDLKCQCMGVSTIGSFLGRRQAWDVLRKSLLPRRLFRGLLAPLLIPLHVPSPFLLPFPLPLAHLIFRCLVFFLRICSRHICHVRRLRCVATFRKLKTTVHKKNITFVHQPDAWRDFMAFPNYRTLAKLRIFRWVCLFPHLVAEPGRRSLLF